MANDLDSYRTRYLRAVKTLMADRNIEHVKQVADLVGASDKTLSAIFTRRQYPTVQHGIDLCKKFGYSANWLFLGKGERLISHQATLNEILRTIKQK